MTRLLVPMQSCRTHSPAKRYIVPPMPQARRGSRPGLETRSDRYTRGAPSPYARQACSWRGNVSAMSSSKEPYATLRVACGPVLPKTLLRFACSGGIIPSSCMSEPFSNISRNLSIRCRTTFSIMTILTLWTDNASFKFIIPCTVFCISICKYSNLYERWRGKTKKHPPFHVNMYFIF